MLCTDCGDAQLAPTLVTRISGGFERTLYIGAVCIVLLLGAGIGLGLAVTGDPTGMDWRRSLVVIPVTLVVCTPLVIFGALRMVSEEEVLVCPSCQHSFDRTDLEEEHTI